MFAVRMPHLMLGLLAFVLSSNIGLLHRLYLALNRADLQHVYSLAMYLAET